MTHKTEDKRRPRGGYIPLYKQIADTLREEIQQAYRPDQSLPTQRQLAERFHASYVTIGNALKELVNEGLVTRTAGVGTRVCNREPACRGLVGVLTSVQDPLYMSQMVGTVESELRRNRLRPLLFGGTMNYDDEKRAFQEMGRLKEVGLIIYSVYHQRFNEEIVRLRCDDIPVVAVLRPIDGMDWVRVDERLVGTLQAQYVAECGFQRILYIGRTGVEFGDLQLAGFVAGATDAGLQANLEAISCPHAEPSEVVEENLKARMVQIITEKAPALQPDVLVTFGDRYLATVCQTLRSLGFEPGEDVALVGADNQNLPGISYASVDQRLSETGKIAAQMLIDRIDQKYDGPPRTATVLPQLVRHGM